MAGYFTTCLHKSIMQFLPIDPLHFFFYKWIFLWSIIYIFLSSKCKPTFSYTSEADQSCTQKENDVILPTIQVVKPANQSHLQQPQDEIAQILVQINNISLSYLTLVLKLRASIRCKHQGPTNAYLHYCPCTLALAAFFLSCILFADHVIHNKTNVSY